MLWRQLDLLALLMLGVELLVVAMLGLDAVGLHAQIQIPYLSVSVADWLSVVGGYGGRVGRLILSLMALSLAMIARLCCGSARSSRHRHRHRHRQANDRMAKR